jgi:hypothetical protein
MVARGARAAGNKDDRHERLAWARALRATALLILKRHGFTEHDDCKLEIARVGKVKIEYRST